jgi:RNA 3'-terminal phosphate cyclase (ATP)
MIDIDGSEGEGGGQIARYAAALSLVTGEPFTIRNVRARREKPGLMRQHVTALEAVCAIGDADCSGLAVGSREITFRPGRVRPGTYHFAVGTAGSTGLVLQAVLVPLILADAPSRLVIEGGTHAMGAPPFEFIERSLLGLVNRMGPAVVARLERHGFYPRGGGRIVIDISPSALRPLECIDRGALKSCRVEAIFDGVPFHIAERELKSARKVLAEWPEGVFIPRELADGTGPGNALIIEAEFEHVVEVMSAFGKIGVPAERLATTAARRMAGYLASQAFAGPYLQDQLLLPFAMARGGAFTMVKLSEHTRTAAALIERFTGTRFRIQSRANGANLVEVVA